MTTMIIIVWLLLGYAGSKIIKELFKRRYTKALGDSAWTRGDTVVYSLFILAGPINLLSTLFLWVTKDWNEL